MRTKDQGRVYVEPGEGRTVQMPGKELVTRKVAAGQTGGAYSLFEVTVPPDAGSQPHIQHHEDECFYVLEGNFEFLHEDDEIEAVPGSLIYIPKGNLHAFKNSGTTTGRLLVLQTPGGVYERYVEEIGEPVGDPAQDNGISPAKKTRPVTDPAALGAKYSIEIVSFAVRESL